MDVWRPEPPSDDESIWSRFIAWLKFVGPLKVVGSAIGVVIVGAIGWVLVRPSQPGAEATLGTLAPSSVVIDTEVLDSQASIASSVLVHVAGAVYAPGVHEVPIGARVVDALSAAGGPLPRAATDTVNLAAPVTDGERIYLPAVGEIVSVLATATSPAAVPSTAVVNINSATPDELDSLPGIGPSTAAAIIARRNEIGFFVDHEDLLSVPGIGPNKVDALRGLIAF